MKLRETIQRAVLWMRRVVTQPRSELTRWEHAARSAYELTIHGGRQLRQDNAPQMAGALAFRTLFGLLPVLIVATLIVRAMKGGEFEAMVADLLQRVFGDPVASDGETLPGWIMGMVERARTIDLTALGSVGVALLVYSAVSLMVTIEDTFNRIYRAPEGRTWFRRLPVYWTLLTLGPLALGALVYANARFDGLIESLQTWTWLAQVARTLWSGFVLWLLLLAMYRLLPAAAVQLKPAMVGALVSTLLVGLGQQFLGAYLMNMQSIKLLGSVGLIPVFMFWVYLMWLGILLGLEVAVIMQRMGARGRLEDRGRERQHRVVDPAVVVPLMERVAAGFARGERTTPEELAEGLGLTMATVRPLLQRLTEGGFLHTVDEEQQAVTLARPPEAIPLDALLAVGHELAGVGELDGRSTLLSRLRAAERELATGMSLAEAGAA